MIPFIGVEKQAELLCICRSQKEDDCPRMESFEKGSPRQASADVGHPLRLALAAGTVGVLSLKIHLVVHVIVQLSVCRLYFKKFLKDVLLGRLGGLVGSVSAS